MGCRSCGEVFKDPGFLMKFIELILILLVCIILTSFSVPKNSNFSLVMYDVGQYFTGGVYMLFMPVLAMFIIYIMSDFPDKMYELVVCIVGAIASGLAGILFLALELADSSNEGNSDFYNRYSYMGPSDNDNYRGHQSDSEDPMNMIVGAIFMILIMVAFIIDAVLQKLK